jgi:hypothetical protein
MEAAVCGPIARNPDCGASPVRRGVFLTIVSFNRVSPVLIEEPLHLGIELGGLVLALRRVDEVVHHCGIQAEIEDLILPRVLADGFDVLEEAGE